MASFDFMIMTAQPAFDSFLGEYFLTKKMAVTGKPAQP
jgi:hypothetical protein